MPLATNNEALAEFGRNAGSEFPDRQWLLTGWDVWVQNPHYCGPPQRHPEEDPEPTDAEIEEVLAAQDRAERDANAEAYMAHIKPWIDAMTIHRAPGCTCSDRQMEQVGCDCGAEMPF